MLQASHPAGSAEREHIDALRSAIEGARSGVSPSDASVVLERLGLPTALSALAHAVREAQRCTVRESIDDAPPLSLAQAVLIFRAASWALDVLCSRRPPGESAIGLAAEDAHVVLHVQSTQHTQSPLSASQEAERARLSQQVTSAGGTWQWTAGDDDQRLTVTLPAPSQQSFEAPASEPLRA